MSAVANATVVSGATAINPLRFITQDTDDILTLETHPKLSIHISPPLKSPADAQSAKFLLKLMFFSRRFPPPIATISFRLARVDVNTDEVI